MSLKYGVKKVSKRIARAPESGPSFGLDFVKPHLFGHFLKMLFRIFKWFENHSLAALPEGFAGWTDAA